jgi:hypothetical protein
MKTQRKVDQLVFTHVQAMMSGVWRARRAHDLCTLEYSDGSTESGKITDDQWLEGHAAPLELVSLIQSQRK